VGVKNKQVFDESFLMTVATVGAVVTGEYSEAVAVMLFYQVGEWFQDYAVGRSAAPSPSSWTSCGDRQPVEGRRQRGDHWTDDVVVGDTLVIRPGERIPWTAPSSGREPCEHRRAHRGSVPGRPSGGDGDLRVCNGEGLLKLRAEKVFEDSPSPGFWNWWRPPGKEIQNGGFFTRFPAGIPPWW
jgi:Cd2+/Zn2+-exporting ATPase